MKKSILTLVLLLAIAAAPAQKMQFGRLVFTVPSGFRAEKSNQKFYIYNLQKQICAVVYSNFPYNGSLEETQWQLWNTQEKFPNYIIGEMIQRYYLESNGVKGIRADYETNTEKGFIGKSAVIFESDETCDAVLAYSNDAETKYAVEGFLKSIGFIAPVPLVTLSPLERSFQWYRTLRGPDISNSSLQAYQSQTVINFTGFISPSQQHLQTLGDSLFYLRELPNLQSIFIGQTRLDDAAAINIGTLRTVKQIVTVSQGFSLPITNAGLQGLSNALTLEELDLQGIDVPGVTDDGLAHIAKLTRLSKLTIARASLITINGFERLTTLKQLRTLNLSYCILSDEDIPRLASVIQQLPALQTLYIQTTNMSAAGTTQLRQMFPGITIYR